MTAHILMWVYFIGVAILLPGAIVIAVMDAKAYYKEYSDLYISEFAKERGVTKEFKSDLAGMCIAVLLWPIVIAVAWPIAYVSSTVSEYVKKYFWLYVKGNSQ